MTTLTANELAVLKAIDTSEYGDFLQDSVWTFTIADNSELTGKTISGTVSSLVKKGLVICSGTGNDQTIRMTEAGITVYLAAIGPGKSAKVVRQ